MGKKIVALLLLSLIVALGIVYHQPLLDEAKKITGHGPAATVNTTGQNHSATAIKPGPDSSTPALVGNGADSFASYLHYPTDALNADSAVQFYCDVTSEGVVTTTYAVLGDREEFRRAVRTALDWGHFTPATADKKPTAVYLGGTVLFLHQDGKPLIVVSLASAERERVGKLGNYLQPQLIGTLRELLLEGERSEGVELPRQQASAEALVQVDDHGRATGVSIIAEQPKQIGLGEFLSTVFKHAHYTAAYADGKPTAGQLNVVIDFDEY